MARDVRNYVGDRPRTMAELDEFRFRLSPGLKDDLEAQVNQSDDWAHMSEYVRYALRQQLQRDRNVNHDQ